MKLLTYRDLKHRLKAFTLKHKPDKWGGYQDVWKPFSDLWGYVVARPQSTSGELRAVTDSVHRAVKSQHSLRCDVFIRRQKFYEKLQGFERLNKFLRVIESPIVLDNQPFVLYRTVLEDKPS